MSDDLKEKREAEEGYRVTSAKAVRLAEWHYQREQRNGDFAALVNRLRARNWVRKVYSAGGARLDQLRAKGAAWMRAHKATQYPKQKERRWAAYRAHPTVLRCHGPSCGAEWCPLPFTRGLARHARFCSEKCALRAKHGHRPQEQGWGAVHRVREYVLAAGRAVTAAEARQATGASSATVTQAMRQLVERGAARRLKVGVYEASRG